MFERVQDPSGTLKIHRFKSVPRPPRAQLRFPLLYNFGGDDISLNETDYVVLANEAKGNKEDGINAVGNINGGGNFAVGNGSCNASRMFLE